MTSSTPFISINLLPPKRLYCDFNYWSSLFINDLQLVWDKCHGRPLNSLPSGISDMIFPYLLIALADYKSLNKKKLSCIGIDNLIALWFDKYSLNRDGYFELIPSTDLFE